MRTMSAAAVALVLDLALPCLAHEAHTHERAELVPTPEFRPPLGEASGLGHYHTVYRNPTLEYGGVGP